MGSLGGDISANFSNPAGLAFYKTGDLVLTPLYQMGKAKASYFNRTEKDENNKLLWGTSGFVTGSGRQGKKVRNMAFSIAMNRSADFNSDILYRGLTNQSSYSQKYLEEISGDKSGNSVSENYTSGASLAFRTYWIDTVGGGTEGNFNFQSRAQNILGTGLIQQQMVNSKGGINEFALGIAASYNDKVMIGGSIGIPILRYVRSSVFDEVDATANANNNFESATVEENLTTKGVGFNLRLGLIYKPQEYWRLGLALQSPTFYDMKDSYDISVTANAEKASDNQTLVSTSSDFVNAPFQFDYNLITPFKATGSVSYVLREIEDVSKQKGFLTADVEYINYKGSSFMEQVDENEISSSETKAYLKSLNRAIDKAYKGAFNLRVGGELKFTTLMVRLGAAYFGNPYKNINGEKGNKLNLSGGLGYRDRGFFVDLTYVHSMQKDIHFPYRLESGPYTAARLKSNVGNALLTVGIKF
jgi:long-subunit fatty acid transport protein